MQTKLPISEKDLSYVVEKGKPRSVILGIDKFHSLIEFIEDLEDSIDLKRTKKEAAEFEDFNSIVKSLKVG